MVHWCFLSRASLIGDYSSLKIDLFVMDQRPWLVIVLLPCIWSISWKLVDSARPLQTQPSQKNTWPWVTMIPSVGQPTTSNLVSFAFPFPSQPPPPSSFPKFALPPVTLPSLPPFSSPKFPSLPPFSSPKFPSIPPISQPVFSLPGFSQPQPTLPSVPSMPGKPAKAAGWLPAQGPSSWSTPALPPLSFPWNNPSPPPPSFPWTTPTTPTLPSFPWNNPSPSPPPPTPTLPSFPWNNPSPSPPPPTPTLPSFPWNNPSPSPPLVSSTPTLPSFPWNNPSLSPPPPTPTLPSFPWNNPSPSPPVSSTPTLPSFPWNNPSPSPPPMSSTPTLPSLPWNNPSPSPPPPTIPTLPIIPAIPILPWSTPSPPPATPSFPWSASPPPPTSTFPQLNPSPTPPPVWVDPSTLPPFGLPPDASLFPTGIQFTFSNFSNSWLPDMGVKVTWTSVITVELSLQLLVEAIVKPITLIISQFTNPPGPGSWGWKSGLIDGKYSADVGATCTTLGKNGYPKKGLIVVQAPIDNTINTAITWFTVLFNGWSKEMPFNATLDHTPGTFGGFVTNVTNPNLKSFCSHPGSLNRIAAKQSQYVLH